MDNPFLEKDISIIQSKFRGINSHAELASFLAITTSQLAYYANSRLEQRYYDSFTIPKKSGGERTIEVPNKILMTVQRKIAFVINSLYHPKNCVSGFVVKRGVRYGAAKHRKPKEIVNFDLENFFPSIHQNRVFGVFRTYFKFSISISNTLASLVCYDHHLIQGSPSSPVISNMILYQMDSEFADLAKRTQTQYTRYVDDLTFSSHGEMPKMIWNQKDLSKRIQDVVKNNGFEINLEKTRISSQSSRMAVTGVIVNEKTNVPREYLKALRAILYNYRYCSTAEDFKKANQHFFKYYKGHSTHPDNVIRGMISYVSAVRNDGKTDGSISCRLMQEYNRIQWPSKAHFKLSKAMPVKYRQYRAIFVVEIEVGTNYIYGTAFIVDNTLFSCFHIFQADGTNTVDKDIKSVWIIEYDPLTDNPAHRYDVTEIKYWPNFDLAVLTVPDIREISERSYKIQTRNSRDQEQVIVFGFPATKQIGESAYMNKSSESVVKHIKSPMLVDKFAVTPTVTLDDRPITVLSNENGGIQPGNSGGPVLNHNQDAVVGIALRGYKPDGLTTNDGTRSEMFELFKWDQIVTEFPKKWKFNNIQ